MVVVTKPQIWQSQFESLTCWRFYHIGRFSFTKPSRANFFILLVYSEHFWRVWTLDKRIKLCVQDWNKRKKYFESVSVTQRSDFYAFGQRQERERERERERKKLVNYWLENMLERDVGVWTWDFLTVKLRFNHGTMSIAPITTSITSSINTMTTIWVTRLGDILKFLAAKFLPSSLNDW